MQSAQMIQKGEYARKKTSAQRLLGLSDIQADMGGDCNSLLDFDSDQIFHTFQSWVDLHRRAGVSPSRLAPLALQRLASRPVT